MAFFGLHQFGFSDYRLPARFVWSVVAAGALTVIAFSVNSAARMPLSMLAVLLSAMFVSALTGLYELRLPKTKYEIVPGTVLAIWAALWIGVSGASLVAAAAAATALAREKNLRASAVFKFCSNVISSVAAAFVFSIVYERYAGGTLDPASIDNAAAIAICCVAMILAGYITSVVLTTALHAAEGVDGLLYRDALAARSVEAVPELTATVVLCLLFARFGMEFGFVVGPAVVFAVIAYHIHLGHLAQKTAEILEASRIHLATVEALATAIDARDQIGTGHVRRTQIYAVGLGKALSLPEDEIDALTTGALLHDIGKLAVPDYILSKPGALTPAELDKTKIHAQVGASILEKVGFNCPVVPTVKHHHEYWNGTGYPDGLVGEEIPLTARILSIAETYDALRSARPYRAPMPREKAREHMLARSGSRFDPKLLSLFIKRLAGFESEIAAEGLGYESVDRNFASVPEDGEHNYVEQIKLANKEVVTLFELAREFSSSESLKDVLSLFSLKIKELVPFETCAVYLIDETRRSATAVHVEGEHKELLESQRITIGEGATGFVLDKGQVVKNVNPDLDMSLTDMGPDEHYSTMASIPLLIDEELIGAVSVYSAELESYGEEHIRVLETVARIAAEAISKSKLHAETKAHALTDPMTGLPNARSLQMQFGKEVQRAARSGIAFQVLVLDLDGFKAVNDTFGHKVGDEMLRGVGKVISEQLREYDFLARYGGDEFVALIPEAGQEHVADLCARIEKAVASFRLSIDSNRYASVGVSVGAAGYPANGQSFDQMMIAADKAMYNSKVSRKQKRLLARQAQTAPLSEVLAQATEFVASPAPADDEKPSNDGIIVELDETAVVTSTAIN